jgi:hypothetical protein
LETSMSKHDGKCWASGAFSQPRAVATCSFDLASRITFGLTFPESNTFDYCRSFVELAIRHVALSHFPGGRVEASPLPDMCTKTRKSAVSFYALVATHSHGLVTLKFQVSAFDLDTLCLEQNGRKTTKKGFFTTVQHLKAAPVCPWWRLQLGRIPRQQQSHSEIGKGAISYSSEDQIFIWGAYVHFQPGIITKQIIA